MDKEYILELENITKEFPGVLALDNVQLRVRKGSVHSLMGENGAGKSTLMKAIIGIHQPTKGTIKWKGQPVKIQGTNHALDLGISMIHQELSPIPYMTVSENIFLGREPVNKFGIVDQKKMDQDTEELLKGLGIDIDPRTQMVNLSIANTQMVEIAKAISYNSDLIIMDEPTSAITEKEVDNLFKIINKLKSEGVAIIYISHKMDEIFKISDDITIFRDGKYIATEPAENLDNDKLVQLMVGRELKQVFHKEEAEIGDVILEVKNLTREGYFKDVSFEVRRGEILGIAGLMGSGRTEVMESVFGVTHKDAGEIFINGKKVEINIPEDAIKHKMALLTEDRKLTGLYLMLSVQDNMIVANIDAYKKGMFLDFKKIDEACIEGIEKLSVKTPSKEQLIGNLSGGNQQKVLIARWLLTQPDILILDEPTRGIDVGAKAEIHKLMSKLAGEGKAVIMISSELPEVLGMSDRIMVMHEGRKTGELMRGDATQENIMYLATGKK
ncbi:sugar ABC transporter ATP-binding protein [Crassaminicella profunda]|uniref:sugar ABC transporter ATP-binding protein n=1 Tax=Crassaminicella profunda TaxID=1286698 RepID=UPI001CA6C04D|nr:sugar ABC transporter ATP-binding protein [Crassaminicella profunda]QZY55627.1 sugar ABC transporter ATP-binding protein [Crassaminicella profunda]